MATPAPLCSTATNRDLLMAAAAGAGGAAASPAFAIPRGKGLLGDTTPCPWCGLWTTKDDACMWVACGQDAKRGFVKGGGCGRQFCFRCGGKLCGAPLFDPTTGRKHTGGVSTNHNATCCEAAGIDPAECCAGGHNSHRPPRRLAAGVACGPTRVASTEAAVALAIADAERAAAAADGAAAAAEAAAADGAAAAADGAEPPPPTRPEPRPEQEPLVGSSAEIAATAAAAVTTTVGRAPASACVSASVSVDARSPSRGAEAALTALTVVGDRSAHPGARANHDPPVVVLQQPAARSTAP